MSDSKTNSASQPQNREPTCHMIFGQQSNTVYEIQVVEDATSSCIYRIYRAPEGSDYRIKSLSEIPVFLKGERLQKDEERPVNIGDEVRCEILSSNGQMKSFSYIFWPMRIQAQREDQESQEELVPAEEVVEQDEKKCSICLKYLYRCVMTSPCNHSFCSSCLSKYLENNLRNAVCPKCQTDIQGFKKKISGHKLSDDLDLSHPELQISAEEKERMEQRDLISKGAKLKRYADNTIYFGFFKNNKREGKGKFVDNQQNEYDGEWKNDKREGQGECSFVSGDRFQGEWKNDVFDGYGEYSWANGAQYKGEFKEDKFEGEGEYISPNGERYKGNFKNNKRHGVGKYTHADGAKYKGEYRDDKREGQGELNWKNGDKFLGKWKDGMKNGFGEMMKADGSKETGEWKDDVLSAGTKVKPEETPKGVKTGKKGLLSKIFPSRKSSDKNPKGS